MTTERSAPESTAAKRSDFRSGYVAIIGRANVGKSTLLNALLDEKLAIVSPKPHTTRHRLLGVLNGEGFQAALMDTPGYLRKGRDQLDSAMAAQLASALADAHLALLVVEPRPPGDVEQLFMQQLERAGTPAVLVVNKVDTVGKTRLLPVIDTYSRAHPFQEIVPVSAVKRDGLGPLTEQIAAHLPAHEPLFPPELLTDRPASFRAAEAIREKVFQLYGDEIPYYVAVEIDDYEEREGGQANLVHATIYVDKPSQKSLLIGRGGHALKEVGTQARPEIEALVGKRVYLELWVKVNPKWRRKAGFIQRTL